MEAIPIYALMAISFKNVGIRTDSLGENPLTRNRSIIPFGIRTPLQLSDGSGPEIFVMNDNLKDKIRDNLKNLILTNYGERVMQYNFGANLRPLLAEYYNKDAFDSEAMIRINTAINKFMPFIVPVEFESVENYSYSNKLSNVKINITYSIPNLQIQKDQIQVSLLVI